MRQPEGSRVVPSFRGPGVSRVVRNARPARAGRARLSMVRNIAARGSGVSPLGDRGERSQRLAACRFKQLPIPVAEPVAQTYSGTTPGAREVREKRAPLTPPVTFKQLVRRQLLSECEETQR